MEDERSACDFVYVRAREKVRCEFGCAIAAAAP